MAQYVKNSINYHGARSKTTTEATSGKNRKGKKKNETDNNQNNSWERSMRNDLPPRFNRSEVNYNDGWGKNSSSSGRNNKSPKRNAWETGNKNGQTAFWGDNQVNSDKKSPTLWNEIEHDFPSLAAESAQRKPNVWKEREKKFNQMKSLEPTNEDEEEQMIKLALELSKAEIHHKDEKENLRKKIEEEYKLQEAMLMNNPSEFKEFILPEESNETKCIISENDSRTDKQTSKPFSNTSNSGWDSDNWDNSFSASTSGNWDTDKNFTTSTGKWNNDKGYTTATSECWDTDKNYTTSTSSNWDNKKYNTSTSDNWDNDENFTSQTYSNQNYYKNTASTSKKLENWGDTSSSVIKGNDSSKNKSSKRLEDIWGDETDSTTSKQYSPKTDVYNSSNKIIKEDTNSRVNKVINMFGGWGSATDSFNGNSNIVSANECNKNVIVNCNKGQSSKYNKTAVGQTDKKIISKDHTIFKPLSKEPINHNATKMEALSELNFSHEAKNESKNITKEQNELESQNLTESIENSFNNSKGEISAITNQLNSTILEKQIEVKSKFFENIKYPMSEETITAELDNSKKNSFSDQTCTPDPSANNTSISNQDFNNLTDFLPSSSVQIDPFRYESNISTTSPNSYIPPPKPACATDYADNIKKESISFEPNVCMEESLNYIEPPKPINVSQPTTDVDQTINHMSSLPSLNPTNASVNPAIYGLMNPSMVAGMNPSMVAGMNPNMMAAVNPNWMLGMNPNMMLGMNPNMMAGINPLLMQQMLMLNPFIASQLQALDMYYRSMGLIAGPQQLNPQINPEWGSHFDNKPDNIFEPNLNNQIPIPDTNLQQSVINPPIYSSNNIQTNQDNSNENCTENMTNPNLISPEISNKSGADDSWLLSYLSNNDEASIPPPILPPKPIPIDANLQTLSANKSTENSVNESLKFPSDFNCNKSNAELSFVAAATEPTGWGDLDDKASSQYNSNSWDDDIDGWGNDNFPIKSMSNPSSFNTTKKSSNRQPISQPNFSRYRK